MNRTSVVVWRGVLALLLLSTAALAEQERPEVKLLREGMVLKNVDGIIGRADSNDLWHFELEEDVNEPGLQVPAGTRLALLPSALLENLIVDANDRQTPRYRLTAQATQYQGTNYLLPGYYLPLSKLRDANEPAAPAPRPQPSDANATTVSEPSDAEMAIPPEIAKRLRNRRTTPPPQRPVPDASATGQKPRRPLSRILVDAVGFIETQQGQTVFVPDTFGRNVSELAFPLLPNQLREQTEQQVAVWPERTRLMVAGLVTEYRGRKYLLLQRVIRVYSHGNFDG